MPTQFLSIGILVLLSAMLPGPDFAVVTRNTITHSRRAGIFTALGISLACSIHITYCLLGVAIVISQSILLFNLIKYIGAVYLIYLGINALRTHKIDAIKADQQPHKKKSSLSDWRALQQGFLCCLLNPKATLFFLALFTVIIKPQIPMHIQLAYALEMILIIAAWFCSLALLLSHRHIIRLLNKAEVYISKCLGIFLIMFGILLVFIKN